MMRPMKISYTSYIKLKSEIKYINDMNRLNSINHTHNNSLNNIF